MPGLYTHPHTTCSLGQRGSLAAERGTLLWALQGTLTPASPAACRIPFAVGALMPLTEGVLRRWRSKSPP